MLADAPIYDAENKSKLTEILQERTKLSQSLEESEMQWLELQESIDMMEQEAGLLL